MDAQTLGSQIAMLRKQRGLTQKDLAEQLHVTDKSVSKWERGLNFPEITLLEPLAKVLGTTVIQLMSLEKAAGEEITDAFFAISNHEKQKFTTGLFAPLGYLIGSEIYTIHKLPYLR